VHKRQEARGEGPDADGTNLVEAAWDGVGLEAQRDPAAGRTQDEPGHVRCHATQPSLFVKMRAKRDSLQAGLLGQRSHPEQWSGRAHTSSNALDVHAVDGAQEVAQQDLAASRSGPGRRKPVYHQPIPTRTSARLASIEDYPDADRLGRVCAVASLRRRPFSADIPAGAERTAGRRLTRVRNVQPRVGRRLTHLATECGHCAGRRSGSD
jgi:hypothetical protein